MTVIPMLRWKPTDGFRRFVAEIDGNEFFVINYDKEHNFDRRWALSIRRRDMAVGVLLHRHSTLHEARQAATRHLDK